MPATRLTTTAIGMAAYDALRNSGVSSRQKNSAARYHIGQCGSAQMSLMSSWPTYTRNSASTSSKTMYGTTTVRNSARSRSCE